MVTINETRQAEDESVGRIMWGVTMVQVRAAVALADALGGSGEVNVVKRGYAWGKQLVDVYVDKKALCESKARAEWERVGKRSEARLRAEKIWEGG